MKPSTAIATASLALIAVLPSAAPAAREQGVATGTRPDTSAQKCTPDLPATLFCAA